VASIPARHAWAAANGSSERSPSIPDTEVSGVSGISGDVVNRPSYSERSVLTYEPVRLTCGK
jgi:hypothetical protein